MKSLYLSLLVIALFYSCNRPNAKNKPTINADYDLAFELRAKSSNDSAFLFFNRAKDIFAQAKDTLGMGKCMLHMAIISTEKGDYFGSQELSLAAQHFFVPDSASQHVYIRSNLNNLGIATYNLGDYTHALEFYDQALVFSQNEVDTRICLNNKAKVYDDIGNYSKALQLYKQVIDSDSIHGREYARTLSNIAMARWKKDQLYNPVPLLKQALEIREKEKDLWGMNASYSHFAEYYASSAPTTAYFYAKKMLHVATEISSAGDRLQAFGRLIKLAPADEYKNFFTSYQYLQDSLQLARNNAKNQFALIRYQSERIRAEKLQLQRDNTSKNYQVLLLSTGILGVIIFAYFYIRRRRQRINLEAERKIREGELKTSKRVHDVVANGLYRIMTELDNGADIHSETLASKIDDLYEKSRDISYTASIINLVPFNEIITELFRPFGKQEVKISIIGNEIETWKGISGEICHELEQVLGELMVNMDKHSGADRVVVRFEQKPGELNISYRDNGRGIAKGTKQNNGLRNTGNRIAAIKGKITFGPGSDDGGLSVSITIPVYQQ